MLRTKFHLAAAFSSWLIFTGPLLCRADDERTVVVNQQLDAFESSQIKAGDAEKEFTGSGEPARETVNSLLKDVFNPGLSWKPAPKTPSNVTTRVHSLDMGTEVFYYRYQEPDLGVMIHGPMYGYFADYAYRPADPNFFNNFLTNVYMVQARYASSHDFDYKGSGDEKGVHDEAMEFRGLIGKDYFVGTDTRITPYFGFGYRYLFDHGNGTMSNTGAYGYDRKAHYYYLPLGWDAVIDMPRNWEVDLNAEYDIFIKGMQKSFLGSLDSVAGDNFTDVVNPQDNGFGIRASVRLLKRGSKVDFYVEPYIRYWNIEQSKIESEVVDNTLIYLAEPKNNTTEYGTKFGIQF